jgi:hypothetical protein
MLDFRSVIVPRFVYVSRDALNDGALVENGIRERIEALVRQTDLLATAVEGHSN